MAAWRTGRPDGPFSVLGLGIAIAVIVLDQLAKLAVTAWLPAGQPVELLPILTLYRVENTGIAFSLLSGGGGPLVIVTLAITVAVAILWARSQEGGPTAAVGFALILGGALGNLIDRVRLGHVVDFLLLHFGDWALFVFNLADAALTLGPILLLAVYLWPAKQ